MRTNHFVTVGLSVGLVTLGFAAASCGTDTFGTCQDTNSCGPGGEGGADGESDVMNMADMGTGETGPSEGGPTEGGPKDGGGDVKADGPNDGGMQCEAGLHDCNGKCVNEGNDTSNCGMCGKLCPGPDGGMGSALCDNGVCEVMCNGTTSLNCNGVCYDPHDPMHCGSCTNVCMPPANSMATCASPPTCGFTCNSGYHECNGQCLSNGDDPSMDQCVVADGLGVFVSPTGSDASGNGTKEMPYGTITHAMDVAATGDKRVYACGTFNTAVSVTATDNGVTVYGGLDCASWTYSASAPTNVTPTAPGYALQVNGATGVTFEDFTFTSVAGANPGDSSIAAFVSGSSGILIKRTTITAGAAANGQDQTQPGPTAAAPVGNNGSLTTGGGVVTNSQCSSTGGAGGQPGAPPGNDGNDGLPDTASNKGLAAAQDCGNGSSGKNGAAGANGSDGAGAPTWASFTGAGWMPSAGQVGTPGGVAQGGGGGAALDLTGGGGGGGAGGCGGAAAPAGTGGGSSVAVLVFQSAIDLESCSLASVAAGRGGAGAAGQAGQTGGTHGNGFGNACQGGKGGTGGNGGGGGGGAGGISAGVLWVGTAPTINGASTPSAPTLANVSTGAAGAPGPGGGASNAGKAGAAGAVVQFQ